MLTHDAGLLNVDVDVASIGDIIFVVLDYLGRDIVVYIVLLARALGSRHRGRIGHRGAAAVGDQIRRGRDAGQAAVRVKQTIFANLRRSSGVVAVFARRV